MPSIVAYQASHFVGIRLLWRQAFPRDPPKDAAELSFPANFSMQPDLFLVAIDQDMVVGSAVASIIAGYDGHRGWLYAVAVLQSHQRQGIATALVKAAENRLIAMGCKKINLHVRPPDAQVLNFISLLDTKLRKTLAWESVRNKTVECILLKEFAEKGFGRPEPHGRPGPCAPEARHRRHHWPMGEHNVFPTDGVRKPNRDKNPWSHCADALQYACVVVHGGMTGVITSRLTRSRAPRGRVPKGGWT